MAKKPKQKGYFNPKRMTKEEMSKWAAENQKLVQDEVHKLLLITGDARKSITLLITGLRTYEYSGHMVAGGFEEVDC